MLRKCKIAVNGECLWADASLQLLTSPLELDFPTDTGQQFL